MMVVLAALLAVPGATAGAAGAGCVPRVVDGWLRLPPARMPMLAGFGRIVNDCEAAATVVAASSPAFGSVELHETRVVDGVSRMRPVPELPLAAGATATLEPGALHLMLMQPRTMAEAGDRVAVSFTLSDGRTFSGEFEARPAAP